MASWLSNLSNNLVKRLDTLADSLVTQATAAQAEIAAEQSKLKEEEEARRELLATEKPLPWETDEEERTIFEHDTMERILQLSLREENFTVPPRHLEHVPFVFSEFVPVVLRLLQLDANLARMHARLASKMNEETFWHFYFYRIMYLRASIGIDGPAAKDSILGQLSEDEIIIFHATREYEVRDTETSVIRRKPVAAPPGGAPAAAKADGAPVAGEDDLQDMAQVNRRKAEAELAAEVQAELDNDDDLLEFDPDDDDLGALAIDGQDLSCEVDEDDAELEAQIARELEK